MGIVPGVADGGHDAETVVSQIAHGVFGESPMYYAVQYSTFLILFLAANTAYSDFPRLAYFLGRDKFLPHQFTFRGDRLAYSVGIVVLGIASSIVLWGFGGSISRLIPLYAFGVFSAFTLSQAGMVVRWWRRREPGWQRSIIFNGVGARGHVRGAAGRRDDQVLRRRLDGGGAAAAADPAVPRASTRTTRRPPTSWPPRRRSTRTRSATR